jgi:hypothetical protein
MTFKKINLIIIIALLFLGLFYAPVSQANTFNEIMGGFAETGREIGYRVLRSGAPTEEFAPAWWGYVGGLLVLMAILFMILIIYSGFLWMSARGREEQVERAKKIIIQAIVGLSIIISARLLIELVLFVLKKTLTVAE